MSIKFDFTVDFPTFNFITDDKKEKDSYEDFKKLYVEKKVDAEFQIWEFKVASKSYLLSIKDKGDFFHYKYPLERMQGKNSTREKALMYLIEKYGKTFAGITKKVAVCSYSSFRTGESKGKPLEINYRNITDLFAETDLGKFHIENIQKPYEKSMVNMERRISKNQKENFNELRKNIVSSFINIEGFSNTFSVEEKDNKVKLWLILKFKDRNDALIFYYTLNSDKELKWIFVPDYKVNGEDSKRKKRFKEFAENRNFPSVMAREMDTSITAFKVDNPHARKGFRFIISTNPNDWIDSSLQRSYVNSSINFLKAIIKIVNEWYLSEGEPKVNKEFESYLIKCNPNESQMMMESVLIDELEKTEIKETEKEQLIKSRIGQSVFKKALQNIERKCKLCGVLDERFLIASHIKPWSQSDNDERLDVNNGLLLCPNHDALFDKGYISFNDEGVIIISATINETTRAFLNINKTMKINMSKAQQIYMQWHREHIFK